MIALSIVNEAVLKFNQQDNGDRTILRNAYLHAGILISQPVSMESGSLLKEGYRSLLNEASF